MASERVEGSSLLWGTTSWVRKAWNRAENSGSVSAKGEGVWAVSDMVGPPFCCLDTAYNLEYTPSQALFAKNPKKGG